MHLHGRTLARQTAALACSSSFTTGQEACGVQLQNQAIAATLTGMAESRYLTLEEAAAYLRISPRYLRSETLANNVPAARVGKRLLFVVEDLDDYVRARRPGRVDEPPLNTD